MNVFHRLVDFARPYKGRLLLVALLTSAGALSELVEPWVYRAIVNDIAGVFVTRATRPWEEVWDELRGVEPEAGAAEVTQPEAPPPVVQSPPPAPVAPTAKRGKVKTAHRSRHRPRPQIVVQAQARATLPPRTVADAFRGLWIGVLVLVGAAMLGRLMAALADLLAAHTTNRIEEDFILRTYRHVLRLPFSFFTQRASGTIARQIDQSDEVAPLYTAVVQEVWSELFTAVAIILVMLSVNRELSLIVVVVLLVYMLVTIRMAGPLQSHLEEYYELWDEVSGRIQESVASMKTVRLHGNEDYELQRTTDTVRRAYRAYLQRKRAETGYGFIQNTLVYVSKGLVLILGGMKALEHQLTPGDVVMFVAYLDRIYAPVANLTHFYSMLQRYVASLHRAFRLHDVPEEERSGTAPLTVSEGKVEFRHVVFGYDPQRPVLRDLDFQMPGGQMTALIGPSGGGKTTAADLLLRIYEPQQGAIWVDGQDLRSIDPSSLRKQIAVVSADASIFRETLAENIRYGRLDASGEDVREAALKAGLGPLLERLPEGLNTPIGEHGYDLSMGERQRVLLARVFLTRARIMILDEATANLDFKTEAAVKQTLRELTSGRTALIIAHRQSMLTEVKYVVALRDGRALETGPPAALMGERGYYFQMMTANRDAPELRVQ